MVGMALALAMSVGAFLVWEWTVRPLVGWLGETTTWMCSSRFSSSW